MPDLRRLVARLHGPEGHGHPGSQLAVDDPDARHRALVAVVEGVEYQRSERCPRVSLRRGNAVDDRLQDRFDADPVLRRRLQHLVGVDPHEVGDFVPALLDLRPGQIDLVQHRNHLEVGLEGQKKVGERLGLHPLAGVDDQDRPLAGGQRTRDFVAEVDVSGGVDQVEGVRAPIGGGVCSIRTAWSLIVIPRSRSSSLVSSTWSRIWAAVERPGGFEQPVGQRRLAVVDVGR